MSRVKRRITDIILNEKAQPVILLDDGSELECNVALNTKSHRCSGEHPTMLTLTTMLYQRAEPSADDKEIKPRVC